MIVMILMIMIIIVMMIMIVSNKIILSLPRECSC